jgi:hypothetical protein
VQLLKKYYDCPLPERGGLLKLPAPKLLNPITFQRPNLRGESREAHWLVAQWCSPLAWTYLTADTLVDLLEALCREFKLVVVDDNLAMLSAAVLSCGPILHPLTWSGVNLPVLPNRLREFLEAPVPILVGVTELPVHMRPSATQQDPDMVFWFPSQGRIHFHKSFKRLLPNRSELYAHTSCTSRRVAC